MLIREQWYTTHRDRDEAFRLRFWAWRHENAGDLMSFITPTEYDEQPVGWVRDCVIEHFEYC